VLLNLDPGVYRIPLHGGQSGAGIGFLLPSCEFDRTGANCCIGGNPLTESLPSDLEAGVANLLDTCVGLNDGDRFVLVAEAASQGYYDGIAAAAVADGARRRGAKVQTVRAPVLEDPSTIPREVLAAIDGADHTVFMARLGDQVRFRTLPGQGSKTMCYALDAGLLAAPFAGLNHKGMEILQNRLEAALLTARHCRIRCPLGTELEGSLTAPHQNAPNPSGSMRRFPVMTFQPVPADGLSGRVALARWLMGTGSRLYRPYSLTLRSVVFARVEGGRIVDFDGDAEQVARVKSHYDWVARRYGLDRDRVHSWHLGINPGTFCTEAPEHNLLRWGGIAFGAPRYLHFHTCGDEAPAEICWSVFDATVEIDGDAFWKDGRFRFSQRPEIQTALENYEGLSDAYADARTDIGI
jgi:hypothetical protein